MGRASSYNIDSGTRQTFSSLRDWEVERAVNAAGAERFCMALQRNAGSDSSTETSNARSGWAWPTLVLGSGCLEVSPRPGFTADAVEVAVFEAARQGPLPKGLILPAADGSKDEPSLEGDTAKLWLHVMASRFAHSLVLGRVTSATCDSALTPHAGAEPLVVSKTAAAVLEVAVLVSDAYHRMQAVSHAAFGRWDATEAGERLVYRDEDADVPLGLVVAPDSATEDYKAHVSNVDIQSTRALRELKTTLDAIVLLIAFLIDHPAATSERLGKKLDSTTAAVLGAVRNGIATGDSPTISLRHARHLTELAWLHLTEHENVYPGWSDLMLQLMIESAKPTKENEDATRGFRHLRPLYSDITAAEVAVRALYGPPTEQSFASAAAGGRRDLYDAAARLLWAQADNGGSADQPSDDPDYPNVNRLTGPAQPTAVVTSFDLELPMALWRLGTGARRFIIAMPVYVHANEDATVAEALWLLAHVEDTDEEGAEGLRSIQRPARLEVVTPATSIPGSTPVVVYLSGCPLLKLSVNGKSGSELLAAIGAATGLEGLSAPSAELHHAVVLDEYLASRRLTSEVFWWSDESEQRHPPGRSLPQRVFQDEAENTRFWIALGVPVADPAIRSLLTNQLTIRNLRRASAGQAVEAGVEGVFIGTRIDDEEASALHWFGFDVVRANCGDVTPKLNHWCDHLDANKLPGNKKCGL